MFFCIGVGEVDVLNIYWGNSMERLDIGIFFKNFIEVSIVYNIVKFVVYYFFVSYYM